MKYSKIPERVAARKKSWEESKKASTRPAQFGSAPGSRNPKKLKSAGSKKK